MAHVFVAPHPDDAALSCGGLIASLRELGQNVTILTVFSGEGTGGAPTDYQREAAERLHLPFAILSDEQLAFTRALALPTFSVDGMTLIRRMAWVIDEGVITHVFYPVFPPDKSAEEVVNWIQAA